MRKVSHLLLCSFTLSLIGCSGFKSIQQADTHTYPPLEKGVLKTKSIGYDQWAEKHWLQPLGGIANKITFTNGLDSDIARYLDLESASIWTGLYLASQSMRNNTEPSHTAQENVEQAVEFLHDLVEVTGNHVIARFVGPLRPPFIAKQACHLDNHMPCVATTYKGKEAYWLGGTTRDQYSGWFFGMYTAYRLSDNTALKQKIAEDVKQVILQLEKDNFEILPPAGKPAKVASKPDPIQLLAWTSAAAAITNDPEVIAIHSKFKKDHSLYEKFYAELISFSFNKFGSYVGPNLTYLNYYLLIKSTKDSHDRKKYLKQFKKFNVLYKADEITLFDYLAMDLLGKEDPASIERNKQMLNQFVNAPNVPRAVYPPKASLNENSVMIYKANKFLYKEKTFVYPQASKPYPLEYRCASAYAWQQTPYAICCTTPEKSWSEYQLDCKAPPTGNQSFGGVDFLLAYWLGRYNGYISMND